MGEAEEREQEIAKITPRKRTVQKPEELPTLYSNDVQIRGSVFDIVMEFGTIEDVREDEYIVRQILRVALSPQHALALTEILQRRLRDYEATYGPIPRDPDNRITT